MQTVTVKTNNIQKFIWNVISQKNLRNEFLVDVVFMSAVQAVGLVQVTKLIVNNLL